MVYLVSKLTYRTRSNLYSPLLFCFVSYYLKNNLSFFFVAQTRINEILYLIQMILLFLMMIFVFIIKIKTIYGIMTTTAVAKRFVLWTAKTQIQESEEYSVDN